MGIPIWSVSVAFSADGKTLASNSPEDTAIMWDVSSGTELARIMILDDKDGLVVTPEGLFEGLFDDSSRTGTQLIWRLDNNTFNYVPVEAFFNEFYYPGLLEEIIAGKRPKRPNKDLSAVDIRQPQVRITRVSGQAVIQNTLGQPAMVANPAGDRKVELMLEITDNVKVPSRPAHPTTSGAQDVRLFRNGSLVKLWPGDIFGKESKCQPLPSQEPLAPRRSVCTVTVPIVAGENRLAAYAFNSDNVKSSVATLTITGADTLRRKGVVFILAVGINQYVNSKYNLEYAVADAQDFAEELKRQLKPKDNQFLLREWLDYATKRVPQMQQETIERGARGLGLEVIFVEGDENIKDPNKRSLQRPRVFYPRETETTPLVVAKP
jgi:hypothetical protein